MQPWRRRTKTGLGMELLMLAEQNYPDAKRGIYESQS